MNVDSSYWGDPAGTIMTVHNVAKYLRLSEAKIYRMARTGGLPAFRIGKTWRFNKRNIDEWIREKTELTAVQQSGSLGQQES
ncbi:MAG TPA: helix-turn-helix domain-containing protein [Anaerolineales bacterium]|nr:helix-turn-helix domain-containing protein [Anaerolineales bacterium]